MMAKVRYRATKKVHAVPSATTAFREGSLVGFFTSCGLQIDGDTTQPDGPWTEEPPATAADCIRCDRAERREVTRAGDARCSALESACASAGTTTSAPITGLTQGAESVEHRGLTCNVYRHADGSDFTLAGLTSRATEVVLTGPGLPPLSTPDERRPELVLELHQGVLIARPAGEPPVGRAGWMFGGNFIHSSDSRFPTPHQAIRVHDRSEPFPLPPGE